MIRRFSKFKNKRPQSSPVAQQPVQVRGVKVTQEVSQNALVNETGLTLTHQYVQITEKIENETVRILARQYVQIAEKIEPLIGKDHRREYFHTQIGRMMQITETIAMMTGRDPIYVGASLDRGQVYDKHGNQIDL